MDMEIIEMKSRKCPGKSKGHCKDIWILYPADEYETNIKFLTYGLWFYVKKTEKQKRNGKK